MTSSGETECMPVQSTTVSWKLASRCKPEDLSISEYSTESVESVENFTFSLIALCACSLFKSLRMLQSYC